MQSLDGVNHADVSERHVPNAIVLAEMRNPVNRRDCEETLLSDFSLRCTHLWIRGDAAD